MALRNRLAARRKINREHQHGAKSALQTNETLTVRRPHDVHGRALRKQDRFALAVNHVEGDVGLMSRNHFPINTRNYLHGRSGRQHFDPARQSYENR